MGKSYTETSKNKILNLRVLISRSLQQTKTRICGCIFLQVYCQYCWLNYHILSGLRDVICSNTGRGAIDTKEGIARIKVWNALIREETTFSTIPRSLWSKTRLKTRLMPPGLFEKVGFAIAVQNVDVHQYKFNWLRKF